MADITEEAARLFSQGDYEGALAKFTEALEKVPKPQHYVLNANCGACLMSLGRIEEAIQSFNSSLALYPDHIESLHNKGVAHAALENYEEAIKCFDATIKKLPTFYAAHAGQSESLANLGRFEEAISSADAAIKLEPTNPVGYADKAFAQLKLHLNEGAVASYEKAIECGDDSAETRRLFGVALSQLALDEEGKGNLQKGIDLITRSLEFLESASSYHNRGILLLRTDQTSQAIESFKSATECSPDYFESHAALGALYSQQDDNENALVHLEKAISIEPDSVETRYNLGIVKLKLGKLQEAKQEWESVLKIEPGEPNSTEALAILEEMNNNSSTSTSSSSSSSSVVPASGGTNNNNNNNNTKNVAAGKEIAKQIDIKKSQGVHQNAVAKAEAAADQAKATLAKLTGGGKPIAAPQASSTTNTKPAKRTSVAPNPADTQRSFVRDLSSAPALNKVVPKTEIDPKDQKFYDAVARLDLDGENKRRGSVMAPPDKSNINPTTKPAVMYEDYTKIKHTLKELQSGSIAGVDPTKKEQYLSDDDFKLYFKVTREEFDVLPQWKMQRMKKDLKLF